MDLGVIYKPTQVSKFELKKTPILCELGISSYIPWNLGMISGITLSDTRLILWGAPLEMLDKKLEEPTLFNQIEMQRDITYMFKEVSWARNTNWRFFLFSHEKKMKKKQDGTTTTTRLKSLSWRARRTRQHYFWNN